MTESDAGTPTGSPVIGVAGWKNSGKTTLVARLVAEIAGRGLRVATVKHAHHSFDIDHEGTDSWRHREAGASEVALVSSRRLAIQTELRGDPEPSLDAVLARLGPADVVIVEGYKGEAIPKIEIRRREAASHDPLAPADPLVAAIVADHPVNDAAGLPVFAIDAVPAIADFILDHVGVHVAAS
nr:molybdopterin-guanine dinucleotide biosynthesis protein B [Methylobrevis pamukkalensis]